MRSQARQAHDPPYPAWIEWVVRRAALTGLGGGGCATARGGRWGAGEEREKACARAREREMEQERAVHVRISVVCLACRECVIAGTRTRIRLCVRAALPRQQLRDPSKQPHLSKKQKNMRRSPLSAPPLCIQFVLEFLTTIQPRPFLQIKQNRPDGAPSRHPRLEFAFQ